MIDDKAFLEQQRKDREKQILEIVEHLKKEMGFNSGTGSTMFDMKQTPNGPALVARTTIEENALPNGWKYGVSALDGNKEGVWRTNDKGEHEFIPIEHERDKSEVARYSSPQHVVDSILAENPQINKSQITFDNHSGAIQLVGLINDNVKMPAGLEMQDGCIVDINDYGKKYEIRRMFANDVSIHDITAGGDEVNSDGVKKNLGQQAYHEDSLSMYDQKDAHISSSDMSLLNFEDMKYCFEHHRKSKENVLITAEKDNSYKDVDNEVVKDSRIKAQYELAEAWVHAYEMASGKEGDQVAFEGEYSSTIYRACMQAATQCQGKSLKEVAEVLFYINEFENTGMVKTILYFLSDPKIAPMFQLNVNEISPEQAFQLVEDMKMESLHESYQDTFGYLQEKLDNAVNPVYEKEEEVMERMFNPNNNGTRY